MPSQPKNIANAKLIAEWTLPPAATLGSSVRAKGILLEIRARLPWALRKSLDIRGAVLTLSMPETAESEIFEVSTVVNNTLDGIESLPVIPREIEDILSISTTERHRWLKDGRLQSAGTRTVKLRGRAKQITFHVFDPRRVEDVLDRDLVSTWREDDVATAAENRRRGAWKAKLKREEKSAKVSDSSRDNTADTKLLGWEDFEREGLLR
ncbi:MAG: hypothetical protein JWQ22_287 [Devosia sp.]|nr:hypothetical protein [Devosia sp.]